eukprot:gene34256-44255_t
MGISCSAVSMPLFPSATATILSPDKFSGTGVPGKCAHSAGNVAHVEEPDREFAERSGGGSSLLASSVIAKKFTEWLISTEQIQEVFDLIRLDNDKQNSNQ